MDVKVTKTADPYHAYIGPNLICIQNVNNIVAEYYENKLLNYKRE